VFGVRLASFTWPNLAIEARSRGKRENWRWGCPCPPPLNLQNAQRATPSSSEQPKTPRQLAKRSAHRRRTAMKGRREELREASGFYMPKLVAVFYGTLLPCSVAPTADPSASNSRFRPRPWSSSRPPNSRRERCDRPFDLSLPPRRTTRRSVVHTLPSTCRRSRIKPRRRRRAGHSCQSGPLRLRLYH
jgi:hypothetical protein